MSADNTGYGAQTDDYRGYTQNELWIVIDDSKVWNKTKNLTIYKENPDTNPNAQLAGTTGDSIYEHDEAEVNLYNINSDDCVDAFVSGYVSSKSIAGIPVDVMLNKGNLPVGKYFIRSVETDKGFVYYYYTDKVKVVDDYYKRVYYSMFTKSKCWTLVEYSSKYPLDEKYILSDLLK